MSSELERYDPAETEDRGRSAYVSRKEWRWVLLALAILGPFLFLIYRSALDRKDAHLCTQNFQQIKSAMFVYMAANNDRLPPTFVESEPAVPILFPGGPAPDGRSQLRVPYTWMSLIAPGMEQRASFRCPSARPEELAFTLHPTKGYASLPATYGLYAPRSGYPSSLIQNPDLAVLVVETTNGGARNSFNPHPFQGFDGVLVGWDDGNVRMTVQSRSVTRLAFYETAEGRFEKTTPARHEAGLNVLFVSGRRALLRAPDARIERLGTEATGFWSDR